MALEKRKKLELAKVVFWIRSLAGFASEPSRSVCCLSVLPDNNAFGSLEEYIAVLILVRYFDSFEGLASLCTVGVRPQFLGILEGFASRTLSKTSYFYFYSRGPASPVRSACLVGQAGVARLGIILLSKCDNVSA